MKDRKALESIFESFINGNVDAARESLHEYFVGQAKSIYQTMMEDEDLDLELSADVPVYGGDEKADFEDDIVASDEDDVEDESAEDVVDVEEPIEDRVDELESTLEDLKAKFDALLADEELEHGVSYDEFGSDDAIEESLTLGSKAEVSAEKEGVQAANKSTVPVTTQSVLKPNTKGNDPRGSAVDFAGGAPEKGAGKVSADHDKYDNFNTTPKKAPAVKTKPVKDDNVVSVIGTKKIK